MTKAHRGKKAWQGGEGTNPFEHMFQLVPELKLTYDELENQSDRGVAIIGGVAIENRLDSLIKTAIVPGTTPPGLGTANSKLQWAYSLGLISKMERAEVRQLFDIRNVFAHELIATSFGAEKVRTLCDKLTFAEKF